MIRAFYFLYHENINPNIYNKSPKEIWNAAHLVLNSVFGGVNLEPQKPGLKTVYKSTE